jgi:hypothetical protein
MPRAVFVSFGILIGVAGCGRSYQFDLVVTVVNSADGVPIEGAAIHRNMWGEKSDPKTAEVILLSDTAGRAVDRFTVTDTAFSAGKPTWYLRVMKEGFETEIVEFKPSKPPAETSIHLEVPVKLRPIKR